MDNIQINKDQLDIKKPGLDAFTLKIIALISMTIDHIGFVFGISLHETPNGPVYSLSGIINTEAYYILRSIGRLAFPIFCFLIAVGYTHTKNIGKYMLRLLVFGLISQVPFSMALEETNYLNYLNVYATLLLGLMGIYFYDKIGNIIKDKFIAPVFGLGLVVSLAVIAEFTNTDYGALGVVMIFVLFLLVSEKSMLFGRFLPVFAIIAVLTLIQTDNIEVFSLLAFVPIYFYNGEQGRKLKYVFYAYYPLHLLILSLIDCVMF